MQVIKRKPGRMFALGVNKKSPEGLNYLFSKQSR